MDKTKNGKPHLVYLPPTAKEGMLRVYAHAEMTEERIAAAKTVEGAILKITGATGSHRKEERDA